MIDGSHNLLYNSEEHISGINALNDILHMIFIKLLSKIISEK